MDIPTHINVLLGDDSYVNPADSPSFALIGTTHHPDPARRRRIGLDLRRSHTITGFGGQGSGKSYNTDGIMEAALLPIPGINRLPEPLAGITFHFSETPEYKPEGAMMILPNDNQKQVADLSSLYKAVPKGLQSVVILTPESELAERRAEFAHLPQIEVHPLLFRASELRASHWKMLMGAIGPTTYQMRVLLDILRSCRHERNVLEALQAKVANAPLSKEDILTTLGRIGIAAKFLTETGPEIGSYVRPGRQVVIDVRDEYMSKEDAFTLILVLFQVFCGITEFEGKKFKRVFKFDELHKYTEERTPLVSALIGAVREMRHKGIICIFASQDPMSVPTEILMLSDIMFANKSPSQEWIDHVGRAFAVMGKLKISQLSELARGTGYIASTYASDQSFCTDPQLTIFRPRATKHGGEGVLLATPPTSA